MLILICVLFITVCQCVGMWLIFKALQNATIAAPISPSETDTLTLSTDYQGMV
jgi:hypothetical protein